MDDTDLSETLDPAAPADASLAPEPAAAPVDPLGAELTPDPGLPEAGDTAALPADLDRLVDVTVELAVEVGRTRMSLGEALALGPGSVVTLDRLADRPVDLLVNGRPIARGEVVVIDEQFGLRITEVAGAKPAPAPQDLPAA